MLVEYVELKSVNWLTNGGIMNVIEFPLSKDKYHKAKMVGLDQAKVSAVELYDDVSLKIVNIINADCSKQMYENLIVSLLSVVSKVVHSAEACGHDIDMRKVHTYLAHRYDEGVSSK